MASMIAPRQAAVSVQAFVDHHQVARLLEKPLVVGGQPAADVDQRVLFRAHRARVGVGAVFLQNLGHLFGLVSRLALLNEVGILNGARGVKDDGNVVLLRHSSRTARMFSMDCGCPPAMFTVPAMHT